MIKKRVNQKVNIYIGEFLVGIYLEEEMVNRFYFKVCPILYATYPVSMNIQHKILKDITNSHIYPS